MPEYSHGLVVLRRDLRLYDHTAMLAASARCERFTLCFVLDPRQLIPHKWQSRRGLAFMQNSLLELHHDLAKMGSGLVILYGEPDIEICDYAKKMHIDALFINRDYTPFSRKRDHAIHVACAEQSLPCFWFDDALLHAPDTILNCHHAPYKVFTAFYHAAMKMPVTPPQDMDIQNRLTSMPPPSWQQNLKLIHDMDHRTVMGVNAGRKAGLKQLATMDAWHDYQLRRDIPALDATTHLSPHLKFGTLSVREIYHYIFQHHGEEHPLLRQLYWRDFFTHVAYHTPHVFGHSFLPQFEHIPWQNSHTKFQAWCEGKTGFLLVDAGMRELAATGLMHNRVRMVAASCLVKDLHVDWRWGESWFARQLLDYDPAVNNGNWQWVASTGCDAQPWFRIFNPMLQQKRFDPKGIYIRRWLPHLREVVDTTLLKWDTKGDASLHPRPIVNHQQATAWIKEVYRHAAQG